MPHQASRPGDKKAVRFSHEPIGKENGASKLKSALGNTPFKPRL